MCALRDLYVDFKVLFGVDKGGLPPKLADFCFNVKISGRVVRNTTKRGTYRGNEDWRIIECIS